MELEGKSAEMRNDKDLWVKREEVLQAELKLALHTYQPKVIIKSGMETK